MLPFAIIYSHRSINRRFHRLESHIVTLAKSIGHLSTEVKTQNSIFMEIDRLGHDLEVVKRQMHSMSLEKSNNHINADDSAQRQPHMLPSAQSNGHAIENLAARATTDGNPQKISKLTRLVFVEKSRTDHHVIHYCNCIYLWSIEY